MLVDDGTYPQAKSGVNFFLLDGAEAFGVDGVDVTSVAVEDVDCLSALFSIMKLKGVEHVDSFLWPKNKPIGVLIT